MREMALLTIAWMMLAATPDSLPAAPSPVPDTEARLTVPCPEGGIERASDLCAQWRAADAATDAARAAEIQSRIGWVQAFIALLTLIAAMGAAIFAKMSVDAANGALKEAVRNAERQFRPWVTFDPKLLPPFEIEQMHGGEGIRINIEASTKNVGQGVAVHVFLDVETFNGVSPDTDRRIREYFDKWIHIRRESQIGSILVPQGEIALTFGSGLIGEELDLRSSWSNDFISPTVAMLVTYRDAFNPNALYYTTKVAMVSELDGGLPKMINLTELKADKPCTVGLVGNPQFDVAA